MLSNETYVLCFEPIKVFLNKGQLNYVCFCRNLIEKESVLRIEVSRSRVLYIKYYISVHKRSCVRQNGIII